MQNAPEDTDVHLKSTSDRLSELIALLQASNQDRTEYNRILEERRKEEDAKKAADEARRQELHDQLAMVSAERESASESTEDTTSKAKDLTELMRSLTCVRHENKEEIRLLGETLQMMERQNQEDLQHAIQSIREHSR